LVSIVLFPYVILLYNQTGEPERSSLAGSQCGFFVRETTRASRRLEPFKLQPFLNGKKYNENPEKGKTLKIERTFSEPGKNTGIKKTANEFASGNSR
jgi:hypothetical protein